MNRSKKPQGKDTFKDRPKTKELTKKWCNRGKNPKQERNWELQPRKKNPRLPKRRKIGELKEGIMSEKLKKF